MAGKYLNRIEQKLSAEASKPDLSYALNPLDEIFQGDSLEAAEKFEQLEEKEIEEKSKVEEEGTTQNKFAKKKPKKHLVGKQNKKKKKSIIAKKVKKNWVSTYIWLTILIKYIGYKITVYNYYQLGTSLYVRL